MDELTRYQRPRFPKFGRHWLYGMFLALLIGWSLEWLSNTTLLFPSDGIALTVCFAASIIVGLVSAWVGFSQSKALPLHERVKAPVAFGLLGFLSTAFATIPITLIVLSEMHFPAQKTRTFKALLPIGRAYSSRANWKIQPTPLWTNIDITKFDYEFMVATNAAKGIPREPSNVRSNGRYCALVTMQRSNSALRVLHAGSYKLPRGSVVLCPSWTLKRPYVEVPTFYRP